MSWTAGTIRFANVKVSSVSSARKVQRLGFMRTRLPAHRSRADIHLEREVHVSPLQGEPLRTRAIQRTGVKAAHLLLPAPPCPCPAGGPAGWRGPQAAQGGQQSHAAPVLHVDNAPGCEAAVQQIKEEPEKWHCMGMPTQQQSRSALTWALARVLYIFYRTKLSGACSVALVRHPARAVCNSIC